MEPSALVWRAERLRSQAFLGAARAQTLAIAYGLLDVTALEPDWTAAKIRALCREVLPHPGSALPAPAAVCVQVVHVAAARAALSGTGVRVASVAGGFPDGRIPRRAKVAQAKSAVRAGAHEVDLAADRGSLWGGRPEDLRREVAAVRRACPRATLKVILETGELADLRRIRRAAWLAFEGGADFVKTSTGRHAIGATPPAVLALLDAARDWEDSGGGAVGVKASGGLRTAEDALWVVRLAIESRGPDAVDPVQLRIGASRLAAEIRAELEPESVRAA